MIEIKNLRKNFGDKVALNVENIVIPSGSIFALFGVNGSGKSTLLRVISGVYDGDEGSIKYDNVNLSEPLSRKDFLYISDDPLSKGQTLDTLFSFYSTFYGLTKENYEKYLKLFAINLQDRRLSRYSKGMRRRVYLAIALAVSPKVLILDEAFDGLDIVGKTVFIDQILKAVEEDCSKTVIIASHSIKEVSDFIDKFVILSKGEVAYDSTTDQETDCLRIEVGFKDCFDFTNLVKEGFKIFRSSKKTVTLLTDMQKDDAIALLNRYNPVLIDVEQANVEELFYFKSEENFNELF